MRSVLPAEITGRFSLRGAQGEGPLPVHLPQSESPHLFFSAKQQLSFPPCEGGFLDIAQIPGTDFNACMSPLKASCSKFACNLCTQSFPEKKSPTFNTGRCAHRQMDGYLKFGETELPSPKYYTIPQPPDFFLAPSLSFGLKQYLLKA